jgi:uncharacterized protein YqfA (UPF0365 family)
MSTGVLTALIVCGVFAFLIATLLAGFFTLYIQALLSNCRISIVEIIGMRLRKTDVRTVVFSHIRATKAGLSIPVQSIETHYLAGGKVPNVVSALIAAKAAGIDLSWNDATLIDLAGGDILQQINEEARLKVAANPRLSRPASSPP